MSNFAINTEAKQNLYRGCSNYNSVLGLENVPCAQVNVEYCKVTRIIRNFKKSGNDSIERKVCL